MTIGEFKKKLMEYPDEKLMAAYEDLHALSENGTFPQNAESFRELAETRQKIYNTDYSFQATRSDILEEIARRWHCEKEKQQGFLHSVGNRIRIRQDLQVGEKYGSLAFTEYMVEYMGKEAQIVRFDHSDNSYRIDIDRQLWGWTDEMFIIQ